MAIKFLKDHEVQDFPPKQYAEGEVIKDLGEASEMHFVRRGLAGFLDEKSGDLFDHEHRKIEEKPALASVLTVSDNRDAGVGRAGETELQDGTPQRASTGPAEVITERETAPKATARSKPKRAAK